MEENLNGAQIQEGNIPVAREEGQNGTREEMNSTNVFPEISFAPVQENSAQSFPSFGVREKCAFAGIILGCIAVISWTIILLGVIISFAGIILSCFGRKSSRAKLARTGLILSIVGGGATIVYVALISLGIINYNYFTNEFWGIPSGGVQVME